MEEERLWARWLKHTTVGYVVEEGTEQTWQGAMGRGPVGTQLLGLPGKLQALVRN